MNQFSKIALALVLGGALVAPVMANDAHHAHAAAKTSQSATAGMTDGEVRKVNKDTGKLTIKHGELKNLGMSPMTMMFRVKDPLMLEQVKPGDKIQFVADKVNGQLTVMQMEVQK